MLAEAISQLGTAFLEKSGEIQGSPMLSNEEAYWSEGKATHGRP